ncbi:TIGR03618 family F420-dependent PPOX class oxidoreductase [Dictyobacter aurantiacus]|uniref:Pyridoxamine 5'-phosphate oxidase N-terminal domain-containing protein n=1 Tax=Dictyobacter aurantiacus TaxID=1936993 RepID=A0A401Z8H3_9CHLR|nr:TIGR03618 family F420-dependent PPOX class oxidoreductase [Dictyobacter aurantiacus]GCE03116.1 hypothetical protein KDAU_04450 [Dictyobacter aurantiacus]
MVPQELQDLLTDRHNAIVAINRPTSGPQLTPVWFLWDSGAFYFRIGKNTAKYRNITRDPFISLLVHDNAGFRYLTVYGQAQIMDNNPTSVASQIVYKYYAPTLASQKLPPEQEPDVVTIKLQPQKVVAIVEEIAHEAADSWTSNS